MEDFEKGEQIGKEVGPALSLKVNIEVESVSDFIKLSGQKAGMTGTLPYKPLGDNLPTKDGAFTLFTPDDQTGARQMTYSFWFTAEDGTDYFLYGYKVIRDDRGLDIADDMTKLFTGIYRGRSRNEAPQGMGILHFHMLDLPSMLASSEVTNTHSFMTKVRTIYAFARFCCGELTDTYIKGFTYDTRYENLVLSGKVWSEEGTPRNLFFFSGIHDKGFPWGDNEIFWDIALILQKDDGTQERYGLTDRRIENLFLDVKKGPYRYAIIGDPELAEWGYISFTELKQIRIPPGIEVDCELFVPPLKASEIKEIRIR